MRFKLRHVCDLHRFDDIMKGTCTEKDVLRIQAQFGETLLS